MGAAPRWEGPLLPRAVLKGSVCGVGRVRLRLGPKLQGWSGEVAGASADAATAQAPVTGASGGRPPWALLRPRSPGVASAGASWQPLPAPCPPGPPSAARPGQLPHPPPRLQAPVLSAECWEAPLRLAPRQPQEPAGLTQARV